METLKLKTHPIPIKKWLKIIILFFLLTLINQFFEQALNGRLATAMESESRTFIILALGLFLNGLFYIWITPIIFAFFIGKNLNLFERPFSLSFVNDFSKEWLRSMGNASLWAFVFIIPGFIRWLEYNFLPFICFFDSTYQDGQTDALVRCHAIAKGHRLKLLGLWLCFGVIIPLVTTSFWGDFAGLMSHPVTGSLIILFESLLHILSLYILWRIYLNISSITRAKTVAEE